MRSSRGVGGKAIFLVDGGPYARCLKKTSDVVILQKEWLRMKRVGGGRTCGPT